MRRQASYKDLLTLFSQAEKRVEGMMQHVVNELAEDYQTAVQSGAPPDSILPGYSDAIIAANIQGTSDSAVLVNDIRAVEKVSDKNEDFTVLYVKSSTNPPTRTASVLQKYAPYALEYFPVSKAPEGVTIEYRSIRASEARAIGEKNKSQQAEIKRAIEEVGLSLGRLDASAEVKEDLVFKILRAESGLTPKIAPHWRPALGTTRRQFKPSVNIADMLSNANSDGYKSISTSHPPVSPEDAADVVHFQDKIS